MFSVRVYPPGERTVSRDTKFDTKREALSFIEKLGELNWIRRVGKMYVVQPKSNK